MHSISALFVSLLLWLAPVGDGWLGVYLDGERDEAVVTEAIPGSPAAKAGVKAGDVIVAVGDQATPTREKLIAVISAASPGDRISLKVRRDGKELTLAVKLSPRPETASIPPVAGPMPTKGAPPAPTQESAPATARPFLGVGLADTDRGVVIERVLPDSPAANAGVAVGDLLQTLGDQVIGQAEDVHRFLDKQKPGRAVAVGLKNEGGVRSVMVTLGRRPAEEGEDVAVAELAPQPAAPQKALQPRRPGKQPVVLEGKPPAAEKDLEAELEALRAELRELRKQLEELRRQNRRE